MTASPELHEQDLTTQPVSTDLVPEADRSEITARLLAQIAETADT